MCWMPGLLLVMSINAVLKTRQTQRQQPRQHPQERMKKLQVGLQPILPFNMTAYENGYTYVIPKLFIFCFLSNQHCLCFKCALQCLRCLPAITAEEAVDTHLCPTMTKSFCSMPSIRVSWSLAESQARSDHLTSLNQLTSYKSVLVSFSYFAICNILYMRLMFVSL